MGGLHSNPKKHLSFSSLLKCIKDGFDKIKDNRDINKTGYKLSDVYTSGFAMFYLQDKALLEFQRRFQDAIQKNNLTTVFGIEKIPSDSQFRDILDNHSYKPILKSFKSIFSKLQRGKYLGGYNFLDDSYLITIDGSDYFTSENIQCEKCLRKVSKGITRYHHQILQATLVHPDMKQVIPFAPEFIRNADGRIKQDCERNAAKRFIKKMKKEHPHLKMIIVGDSLYSNMPFIKELSGLSYILVAKPKDHKTLYEDIEGFRRVNGLDSLEIDKGKDRIFKYEWVNQTPLNANPESPLINFVEFKIIVNNKCTYRSAWVTDIEITKENVETIVRGGRARWKIENEGFNTLKNHGYHLEHNFGHGKKNLSECFFLLNLLAFFFHQIFELSDLTYMKARNEFSARVEFWNTIRAMFRIFIFKYWEQVLEKINGPPMPIST
jgi:hypothetical protein